MRRDVRYRVLFFVVALVLYSGGWQLLPDQLTSHQSYVLFLTIAAGYFLLLPYLYWRWVIVAGDQKAWKIIIVLSSSSLVARLTFPEVFAQYFDFLAWLRYPVIAILLLIQLFLFVHIVRQVWSVRHLKGDPRGHALESIAQADDKQRDLALLLVYEPAAWYYAIPFFSRHHLPVLGHIRLWSGRLWHLITVFTALSVASTVSYLLLLQWSEVAAITVSALIGYTFITALANYRVSKHYSLYIQDERLVINDNFLNFMTVPLGEIESAEAGEWNRQQHGESLVVGKGGKLNLKLTFTQPQTYFAWMGTFQNGFGHMYLCVDKPIQIAEKMLKVSSAPA